MIRRLVHNCRAFCNDSDGAATIDGLIWTVSGLMIASLAIDGSHAWRTQTHLQAAADASALAAAAYLPSGEDQSIKAALRVAQYNVPNDQGSSVLEAQDITFGVYDADIGFTAVSDATQANAVQVDVRRLESRGTQLRTILMGLMGKSHWDVSARAVAVYAGYSDSAAGVCDYGGFISHGTMVLEGNDDVTKAFCVHGERGVKIGRGGVFDDSITISAPNNDEISVGFYSPSSVTLDQITAERSVPRTVRAAAEEITEKLLSVFVSDQSTLSNRFSMAEWNATFGFEIFENVLFARVVASTGTWVVDDTQLQENTIYSHDGTVLIPSGTDLSRVAIIASGSVRHVDATADDTASADGATADPVKGQVLTSQTTSTITYKNSLVVGTVMTLTGSVQVGPVDACSQSHYDSYFLASRGLTFGEKLTNIPVEGMMALSLGPITTAGGIYGAGVYMESGDAQEHIGGVQVKGCDLPLTSPFDVQITPHAQTAAARLVF